jgi:hypothetical protein
MSFFDDLISGVGSFLSGSNSVGGSIAKAALLGLALNKVSNSVNSEKNSQLQTVRPYKARVDQGVRLQVPPAADEKIPVCYGRSTLGGIINDARLSADNRNMYYVLTISERTGTLLSTGNPSSYVFNDVYLNDERIIFESNGIDCAYSIDRDGNKNYAYAGVVEVYCYAGDSDTPQVPEYYTNGSLDPAYVVVPGWTTLHMMEDLIFAVVKITYQPESGLTQIPNMRFNITNSLTLPGDVIRDYMVSTRYGCAIPAGDINV